MSNQLGSNPDISSPKSARRFASILVAGWPEDVPFDAQRVLADHPVLCEHKSVFLDIAFEEYSQRMDAGEKVAPVEFSKQFGSIQKSLLRLLEVNRFLQENSGFLTDLTGIDWPEADTDFLKFHLTDELGRGTFSRVFVATEAGLGDRFVVVKICVGGSAEAQTLGKLAHANIGEVYSVSEDSRTGLTAICMPYRS